MRKQQQVTLAGATNVRDLGGYVTHDGRYVHRGRLLRAGSLASLTDVGQTSLLRYGVSQVIDLRSSAEIAVAPDQLPAGISYNQISLFDNDETESTATTKALSQWYARDPRNGYRRMLRVYRRLVLNEQPRKAYQRIFRQLVTQNDNQAILFHCSAGKDRTGICAMLILGALGVPRSEIYRDYLLTNQNCVPRVIQRVARARRAHLSAAFQSSVIDLSTVSIDYLNQALVLIDSEFGGIPAYLCDGVGLTPTFLQELQQLYLAPASN